jgi:hypothetical protein
MSNDTTEIPILEGGRPVNNTGTEGTLKHKERWQMPGLLYVCE